MTIVSHLHTWYKHQLSKNLWTPISLHRHMDRLLTQCVFHRFQEHLKRSSDEEVIIVRSWKQTKQEMTPVSPRHSVLQRGSSLFAARYDLLLHAVACQRLPIALVCAIFHQKLSWKCLILPVTNQSQFGMLN